MIEHLDTALEVENVGASVFAVVVGSDLAVVAFVEDGFVVVVVLATAFLFFFAGVQDVVTVTESADGVTVDVTSFIGTKEEQKLEALRAIKMALQLSTSLRGSR